VCHSECLDARTKVIAVNPRYAQKLHLHGYFAEHVVLVDETAADSHVL
jgi:hypothetical protein